MLATYMQRMHNNNLEIRIAGSSVACNKILSLNNRESDLNRRRVLKFAEQTP